MTEQFTPTTDEVRELYQNHFDPSAVQNHDGGEEFDRMIAEVQRDAAERAWGEGHAAGRDYQGDGWNCDAHDPAEDNPYRLA